jgi:predicted transcriptional regulator
MLPSINEIEKRRKRLGLSQKKLARMVDISQSMIAKIENGRINPSYLKTKAIFDLLENLEKKTEVKAKDILNDKVVGVQKEDLISKATGIMHSTGYSQLPVFDKTQIVGSISERTIADRIMKGEDPSEFSKLPVGAIMDEALPCVDEETPVAVLSSLLQYNQAIIIMRRGEIKGIITKADLLKVIQSR